MGKNPHPPRRGGEAKNHSNNNQDGLDIVFSNAKDVPKKARGGGADASSNGGTSSSAGASAKDKAKKTDGEAAPEDAPRKPDTRTLIGGASWTGKLPMNLLSAHCQKQKWDKPEYTMVRHERSSEHILEADLMEGQNTGWLLFQRYTSNER